MVDGGEHGACIVDDDEAEHVKRDMMWWRWSMVEVNAKKKSPSTTMRETLGIYVD